MEPAHSLLTLLSTTQPPNNKESEFGATTASKPRRCRRRRRKKILQVFGGKLGIKASFSLFHKKSIIFKNHRSYKLKFSLRKDLHPLLFYEGQYQCQRPKNFSVMSPILRCIQLILDSPVNTVSIIAFTGLTRF